MQKETFMCVCCILSLLRAEEDGRMNYNVDLLILKVNLKKLFIILKRCIGNSKTVFVMSKRRLGDPE